MDQKKEYVCWNSTPSVHEKSYTTTAKPLVRGARRQSSLPKLLQLSILHRPGEEPRLLQEQETQQRVLPYVLSSLGSALLLIPQWLPAANSE